MLLSRNSGFIHHVVLAGSMAALSSLAPVVLLGQKNTGDWARGPNAVSHWLWGNPALKKNGFTVRHTLVGMGTHYLASLFWSGMFAWLSRHGARHAWRNAAIVSALASLIDYQFTPKRFTPGYEHLLSRKELFVVHACLAAGMALSSRSTTRRNRND